VRRQLMRSSAPLPRHQRGTGGLHGGRHEGICGQRERIYSGRARICGELLPQVRDLRRPPLYLRQRIDLDILSIRDG
jgi:hypothetical protein